MLDDQLEPICKISVQTQDLVLRTCQEKWMIETNVQRELGKYVSAAWHDFWLGSCVGIIVRVFANGLGDLGSIPGRVIPKTQKWYLMAPCLTLSNIRYGSRVKWSNSGKGVAPSRTSWCSSYRKEDFVSPSTTVANFKCSHNSSISTSKHQPFIIIILALASCIKYCWLCQNFHQKKHSFV